MARWKSHLLHSALGWGAYYRVEEGFQSSPDTSLAVRGRGAPCYCSPLGLHWHHSWRGYFLSLVWVQYPPLSSLILPGICRGGIGTQALYDSQLQLVSLCLHRVGQSLAFPRGSGLFLEFFISPIPFGVSEIPASLAPSPGYMRQKQNLGNTALWQFLASWGSLAHLHSFLPFQPLCLFCVSCSGILTYLAGGIKRTDVLVFKQFFMIKF